MWSRKPIPVAISDLPAPSRATETAICVSLVLRSTLAVLAFCAGIAGFPTWLSGRLVAAKGGRFQGVGARRAWTSRSSVPYLAGQEETADAHDCGRWHCGRWAPVTRFPGAAGPEPGV